MTGFRVTRVWTFTADQAKRFMEEAGYDEGEYDEDDIADTLDSAEGCELDEYGDCDFFSGHEVEELYD